MTATIKGGGQRVMVAHVAERGIERIAGRPGARVWVQLPPMSLQFYRFHQFWIKIWIKIWRKG